MDHFSTLSSNNETAMVDLGLTVSEIVASMVPVLIGMIFVGIIAVAMLL